MPTYSATHLPLSHSTPMPLEAEEAAREAADARVFVAVVDALFLLVGLAYGARRLKRLPKTYLSEIAFPLDVRACRDLPSKLLYVLTEWVMLLQFRVKLLACAAIFLSHALQWLFAESARTWRSEEHSNAARVDAAELFAVLEALAWVRNSDARSRRLVAHDARGLTWPCLTLNRAWRRRSCGWSTAAASRRLRSCARSGSSSGSAQCTRSWCSSTSR